MIYYYKQLNISYNITDGGDGSAGRIVSEEARYKMSIAKKGKASPRKGIKLSDETKQKLREANLGKHISEEVKEKIRVKNKNIVFSDEHRRKISEALNGRKVSEETRKKLSENCVGNKGMHWRKDPETGKRIYYKN